MRGAPPVRVDCGPDRRWRAFEALVAGTSLASGCGWLAQRLDVPALPIAATAAGIASIGVWLMQIRRERVREIAWSGRIWTLDGSAGRPQVMLEFGDWMLLRFGFDGRRAGAAWMPLDLSAAPDTRHLLRTALHTQVSAGDVPPTVPGHG